jgi:outer membrane protein OmpA-like peptidoglycan-associated protein
LELQGFEVSEVRLAIIASLVAILSGCAGSTASTAQVGHPPVQTAAEWSSSQQVKLQQLLHGTPYALSEVSGGWLIRIAEKDTFNPHRPELLLPAALGSIGQITRHLAQDPDVAVMVVGVATGQYKLKSKEQVSVERAQSVASIFRLNRVPGHRLKTLGVSQGAHIDTHLGVALLVVPEQDLHRRAAEGHTQVVAMLNRD